MTQPKRSRSNTPLACPKRYKHAPPLASLTYDALKEHERNTRPLSPLTRLDIAPERTIGSLSDAPILLPPSIHSLQRSWSTSPPSPSDQCYQGPPPGCAKLSVDVEIPADISHYINSTIFTTLGNDDPYLHQVSEKLWNKSKELARLVSGEQEWMSALYTAIEELSPPGLQIARNKVWREDLIPPRHDLQSTIPRKRNQSYEVVHGKTIMNCSHGVEPLIFTSKVKDPRPDICVGLSDRSLASGMEPRLGRGCAASYLPDMQDTSDLISDPHVTPIDLRFPFLIVEAKAGATGGNLYQAQNQASVGGSTALQIFKNLADYHDHPEFYDETEATVKYTSGAIFALPDSRVNLAFVCDNRGPHSRVLASF